MATGTLASITPDLLPALARFLARSLADMAQQEGVATSNNELAAVEARLRWRLLENPSRGERAMGECVCDEAGEVLASLAYTPTAFRHGDARVTGLLGGYFFASPAARGYGLVVFRRFLRAPGCDFAYSTSLNAASGGIWRQLGGVVPAGCDRELFVPLALGAVAGEISERRRLPRLGVVAIGVAGALASPLWRLAASAGPALRLEPTRDWVALATLAERVRDRAALVAELAAPVLAWRYEQCPARDRIEVLRFTTPNGDDGWLATIESRRGRRQQLVARTVTTLVRPPGFDGDAALLRALWRRYAGRADLLVLGVPNAWSQLPPPRVLRRPLEHPPVCMIGARPDGHPWAESMRFAVGDGDAVE